MDHTSWSGRSALRGRRSSPRHDVVVGACMAEMSLKVRDLEEPGVRERVLVRLGCSPGGLQTAELVTVLEAARPRTRCQQSEHPVSLRCPQQPWTLRSCPGPHAPRPAATLSPPWPGAGLGSREEVLRGAERQPWGDSGPDRAQAAQQPMFLGSRFGFPTSPLSLWPSSEVHVGGRCASAHTCAHARAGSCRAPDDSGRACSAETSLPVSPGRPEAQEALLGQERADPTDLGGAMGAEERCPPRAVTAVPVIGGTGRAEPRK